MSKNNITLSNWYGFLHVINCKKDEGLVSWEHCRACAFNDHNYCVFDGLPRYLEELEELDDA